jgi:acyl-coenzyme A synthetase/AMP-(fatty) acid ligase
MTTDGASVQVADRYTFQSLIRRVAGHSDNQDSALADRFHECRYPQIPQYLEPIQAFLKANGVAARDCVTLEVNNSVRGALTVLALLDAGFSFTTTPVPGQGARAVGSELKPPSFSRFVLTVSTQKPTAALADLSASSFLDIRPNDTFDPAAAAPAEDEPRLFFRTSGSMGAAKLAMYRYPAFYRNALSALAVREFEPSHRIALPTPIFHVYGLGAGFLAGLAGGASIDFQERSNILRFFEREADFAPNVAYVTPSFCEMLIRGRRSPRPYRFMITSGDRISASTFKRSEDLHGPMINQYGATELGVVAATRLDTPYELRCRTVGRPLDGVEFRLVPSGAGTSGQGELQIRHSCGFEGYVDLDGHPLVPPQSFDGEWYRTGDLAEEGPEGTLMVLGRCDLSVNRQGVLLPLAEVESRMRELAGVQEVAVAPGPENLRGRSLVAFCVMADGHETTGSALRASYAVGAPAFSVPEVVHIVSALPKLASGKIDRQSLAKLANEVELR